jgi:hypothetical protein
MQMTIEIQIAAKLHETWSNLSIENKLCKSQAFKNCLKSW